jgi:hypothetical protein
MTQSKHVRRYQPSQDATNVAIPPRPSRPPRDLLTGRIIVDVNDPTVDVRSVSDEEWRGRWLPSRTAAPLGVPVTTGLDHYLRQIAEEQHTRTHGDGDTQEE